MKKILVTITNEYNVATYFINQNQFHLLQSLEEEGFIVIEHLCEVDDVIDLSEIEEVKIVED